MTEHLVPKTVVCLEKIPMVTLPHLAVKVFHLAKMVLLLVRVLHLVKMVPLLVTLPH